MSVGGTILVVGDSISAGYGLENPEAGWVGLLRDQLKASGRRHEVVNASISGDTSAGGLARIDGLLVRYQPIVLILELGANDGLRGLSPKLIQANLGKMISSAIQARTKVLLLGMRIPPNYGRRYNQLYEAVFPALAQQHGVELVPFLLQDVGGNSQFMQRDGLHPNDAAQPLILRWVWEKLAPLLPPEPGILETGH